MVSGRSTSKNSYDSLSIEVDISVQNPNDYYGGIIGWAWEGSVIKNSLAAGEIVGGRKYLGGFAGISRIFYSENNISAVDIFGDVGAYYCSGISGYNFKHGNEHHSIYIKKSVYLSLYFVMVEPIMIQRLLVLQMILILGSITIIVLQI